MNDPVVTFSPSDVLAWAEKQPPGDIAGYRQDCSQCLVARFLQDTMGWEEAGVGEFVFWESPDDPVYNFPPGIGLIVFSFDNEWTDTEHEEPTFAEVLPGLRDIATREEDW